MIIGYVPLILDNEFNMSIIFKFKALWWQDQKHLNYWHLKTQYKMLQHSILYYINKHVL